MALSSSYNYPGLFSPPVASPVVSYVTGVVDTNTAPIIIDPTTIVSSSTTTGSAARAVTFLSPQPVYLTQPISLSGSLQDSGGAGRMMTSSFGGIAQPVYIVNTGSFTMSASQAPAYFSGPFTSSFGGVAQPITGSVIAFISNPVIPVSGTVNVGNQPLPVFMSGTTNVFVTGSVPYSRALSTLTVETSSSSVSSSSFSVVLGPTEVLAYTQWSVSIVNTGSVPILSAAVEVSPNLVNWQPWDNYTFTGQMPGTTMTSQYTGNSRRYLRVSAKASGALGALMAYLHCNNG